MNVPERSAISTWLAPRVSRSRAERVSGVIPEELGSEEVSIAMSEDCGDCCGGRCEVRADRVRSRNSQAEVRLLTSRPTSASASIHVIDINIHLSLPRHWELRYVYDGEGV